MTSLLISFLISMSMLSCMTILLMSCVSCRKIFKKKKKSQKNGSNEKAEVAAIDEKNIENGIANPAYDETANKDDVTKVKNDDVTDQIQPENGAVQNEAVNQTENDGSVRVENECDKATSSSDEAPDKPDNQRDDVVTEDTARVHETVEAEKSPTESVTSPRGPADGQFRYSESIKSNDVNDLSLAIGGRKIHESIAEEEHSAPSASDDVSNDNWTRYSDVIIQGGWRRDVKLSDLLEMGLIDTKTADDVMMTLQNSDDDTDEVPDPLKPFLCGDSPVAGISLSETGETKSIFRSAKDGILRRGTAISLLEAQAATGNIIDPVTGRKMSVAEGFQLGLLDKVYETVVSRAERAVIGYKTRVTEETLSLGQAMDRGLVIESHGIRLLEAQLATGGIIDHRANIKVPIDVAIRRGLLDQRLADKLSAACDDIPDSVKEDDLKTFFDPNTEENVTYRELMRRSVVDDDTGMRLYPLEKIGRKRYSYASYSGRSSLASSRASSRESIPAAVAASLQSI